MTKNLPQNTRTQQAILRTVAYFDIFDHPLTLEELKTFLDKKTLEIEDHVQTLVDSEMIQSYQGYYALSDVENKVLNRVLYNQKAIEVKTQALYTARLIYNLPFVDGIAISGSLSKHVMKDDSDIDFFVVTKKGRIWTAKLFVKLLKVFKYKNDKEKLCTNYFINSPDQLIKEQNRYTATEILTLIPVGDANWYMQFCEANRWINKHLPNYTFADSQVWNTKLKKSSLVRLGELVLTLPGSQIVEFSIRKLSTWRNTWKYRNEQSNPDYELKYRATVDQIKVHNSNHQINTLRAYEELVSKLKLEEVS